MVMLQTSRERNVKVGRAPLVGKNHLFDGKSERKISFSIAVLILLLHKYSSRLYDQLFLKIKFCQSGHWQEKELKYTVSDDQTFYSLLKDVGDELESTLSNCVRDKNITTEINWITDDEENSRSYQFRINAAINGDLPEVDFSCGSLSFFQTAFKNAPLHYNALVKNVLKDPIDAIKDVDYLSNEELREIALTAYGPIDEQISKPEFLDELFEQAVKQFPHSTA